MIGDFDKIAKGLQELVLEEARKVYSEKTIEVLKEPKNVGRMIDPDGGALLRGVCGDTMEIYLIIKDDIITDAKFFTDGCGATVACGSVAAELVKGKSIEGALKISPGNIVDELDGLPEANIHCAILAVNTLFRAIANYLLKKQTT